MSDVHTNEINASTNRAHISHNVFDDEIDLREIFKKIWSGRYFIFAVVVIAAILSVINALGKPDIYRAEAVLVPTPEFSGGGLSGQMGGLASLAGISFRQGKSDEVAVALEVLQSRIFITDFINRRQIMIPLLAAKKWNPKTRELIINSELVDPETGRWVNDKPRDLNAYDAFVGKLKIARDRQNGLIKIKFDHQSPVLAKQWVQWLIDDVNDQLRQLDIEEAQRSIEYLKQQLQQTSVANIQQLLYQMIESQIQTIMMANVRDQYAFKVIDPPVERESKIGPNRKIKVLLTTFLFAIASMLVVLAYHFVRQLKW